MSLTQKIDLNFFTEPQYQKIVMNKFHISQIQVKTTGKIDIHNNEKREKKRADSFLSRIARLLKRIMSKIGGRVCFSERT